MGRKSKKKKKKGISYLRLALRSKSIETILDAELLL